MLKLLPDHCLKSLFKKEEEIVFQINVYFFPMKKIERGHSDAASNDPLLLLQHRLNNGDIDCGRPLIPVLNFECNFVSFIQ